MIRYYALAVSFFLSAQLSADSLISHTAGSFFTLCDLENIRQNVPKEEDVITLNDGTPLKGKLPKLPQLQFPFGKFPLNINDATAIAFSKKGTKAKMQIITHDEYSFVCDIPDEMIVLIQYYPSREESTHSIHQEIDPHTINYILFKERNGSSYPDPERLYTLELKNGDQLPIVIKEEKIQLSNGWRDFALPSNKIVKVTFDDGLYGVLNGENNKEEELDFSFVKDKYLHVQIVKSPQTLGIPWDQIFQIKRIEQTAKKKKSVGAFAWKSSDLGGVSGNVHKTRPEAESMKSKAFSNDWKLGTGWLSRYIPRDSSAHFPFGNTEKREALQDKTSKISDALAEEKKYSKELQDQIQEMTLDAEAFEKQLTILQDSVFSKDKEIEQFQAANDSIYKSLMQQINILTKEKKEGQERLEESVKQELQEAAEKTEKLKKKITHLEGKLTDKASERERTERQHTLMSERFTGKLEEALICLSVQDISINQLRIHLEEEENKRIQLENELARTQHSFNDSEKEAQAISEKHNNTCKQMEILAVAYSMTQSEHEEQLDLLEKTFDQEKKRVQTLEEEIQQLEKNHEVAAQQILVLQNDLEEASYKNVELLGQLKDELSKKEDVQSQLATLQPKYKAEKEITRQLQEKMQRMNELLNESRQALASREEQNRVVIAQIASLTKENQSLSQQRGSLQLELQGQKAAFSKQNELVMRLNSSLHSQKKALNKIEQSHLNLVAELNKAKSVHSNLIQELSGENSESVSTEPNLSEYDVHIVSEGENLNNISMKYYGTPYRWSDIYEMNREVIEDVNCLRVGAALVIPD